MSGPAHAIQADTGNVSRCLVVGCWLGVRGESQGQEYVPGVCRGCWATVQRGIIEAHGHAFADLGTVLHSGQRKSPVWCAAGV